MIIGNKLFYLDEVDSTNENAKNMLKDVTEGAVVLADTQTNGRGRLDRIWYSPSGGIWMSVILKPARKTLIPMMAAVSICEVFIEYDILLNIKWPNDILLNRKKVAGILCEMIDDWVIVGLGINLNIREFPADLRPVATSILIETKNFFDKMCIFQLLCSKLDYHYQLLNNNEARLMDQVRNYTIMLGKNVIVELPDRKISGRVLDLSNDGSLVLMIPDGSIMRILAGDCRFLALEN